MKRLFILLLVFLGLALFIYFHQSGGEERDKARQLEESVFKVKQEDVIGIEIRSQQGEVAFEREGETWNLVRPFSSPADPSRLDTLLSDIEGARIERTLEGKASSPDEYGLGLPRLTLSLETSQGLRTLHLGRTDFSERSLYARLEGSDDVHLVAKTILEHTDRPPQAWRFKKVLRFERHRVREIEIQRPSGRIRLEKVDEEWHLREPVAEKADGQGVSSLLSALSVGEADRFSDLATPSLQEYGLLPPTLQVRLRIEDGGEGDWRTLEVGRQEGSTYWARDASRGDLFTIQADLRDKLLEDLWTWRGKEVVAVEQQEVAQISFQRGGEILLIAREEDKWTVQRPESHRGQEAQSYKFWFPLESLRFESLEEGAEAAPETALELVVELTLQEGSIHRIEFAAADGDSVSVRHIQRNRQGRISRQSFDDLPAKPEDII